MAASLSAQLPQTPVELHVLSHELGFVIAVQNAKSRLPAELSSTLGHAQFDSNPSPHPKIGPQQLGSNTVDNIRTAADASGVAHRVRDFVEKLRRYRSIRVDENQYIAVRGRGADISNSSDIVDILMHHGCTGFLRNLCRAIGARIIDNDQFHAAPALRAGTQDAGYRFRQVQFLVERRNHDAEQHLMFSVLLSVTTDHPPGRPAFTGDPAPIAIGSRAIRT